MSTTATTKTVRVPTSGGWGMRDVTTPGPYRTLSEIKKANKNAGRYYFSPDTMRFFRSQLFPEVSSGRFFIDSIQFVDSHGNAAPREYKLCMVTDAGDVETVALPPADWNGEPRHADDRSNWPDKFSTPQECHALLARLMDR